MLLRSLSDWAARNVAHSTGNLTYRKHVCARTYVAVIQLPGMTKYTDLLTKYDDAGDAGNMGITMMVQKLYTRVTKVWDSVFIPSILTKFKM